MQELVAAVYADWESIDAGAAAYLHAVDINDCLELSDPVGREDAATQLGYFLSLAGAWRGATARAIKAELRKRLREAGR